MELGTLIWIIVLIVGPLALMLFADARGMFDEVGGGAFSTEQYRPTHGPISSSRGDGTAAEREDEIRQLLEARNDRRLARGEAPLRAYPVWAAARVTALAFLKAIRPLAS